jgi:hypothetical protein
MWSGLIKDFYVERWKKYFEHPENNQSFNAAQWEENWINSANAIKTTKIDDPVTLIKETFQSIAELNKKYKNQKKSVNKIKIGKWAFTDNSLKSLRLDITKYITGLDKFAICFEETAKYLLPGISKFYIYENQEILGNVKESGRGFFYVDFLEYKPGADYGIEVIFDQEEAHGSCGCISIQYGIDKKTKKYVKEINFKK